MELVFNARYYTTDEEKIIYYHQHGCSLTKIREYTGCRNEKIRRCINHFENTGEIPRPLTRGRPTKLSTATMTSILAYTMENRMIPGYEVAKELSEKGICSISASTVNRARHMLDLQYKPPKIKQSLTENQKKLRTIFAHSMIYNSINMERIVFSDESRFCLTSDNRFRWYRKHDMDEQCFCTKEKYIWSIMVFGAIGIDFKSKLVICKENIDAVYFREVINQSNLVPDLDAKYGQGQWIFMQDGAPAHSSRLTKLFIQKRMKSLNNWPANSPDMNPIEHLWGAMKQILKQNVTHTKEELIETIQKVWMEFPQESINRLVQSFADRLRMVIHDNGESISDRLRKGIHRLPAFAFPQYDAECFYTVNDLICEFDPDVDDSPAEIRSKRPWTHEEIEILLNKVKEIGYHWKIMATYFNDRTPESLMHKYRSIIQTYKSKSCWEKY